MCRVSNPPIRHQMYAIMKIRRHSDSCVNRMAAHCPGLPLNEGETLIMPAQGKTSRCSEPMRTSYTMCLLV